MTADEIALEAAEQAFNAAMVSNDVQRIRACITDNWVLVTPERGPIPGDTILSLIADGTLSHDTMTKRTHLARVWNDVAIMIGRGRNTGQFQGASIEADEWVCDVYRRLDGAWKCELTQLTPAYVTAGTVRDD
ncbi:nuclear transport factor 2 family protein [Afifella pfennigii]|uniref:nuclear transport factor 2 family protein n=1 Tax=Afifella pfennigii TaxID=209897 RepID=UPI00047904F8|nr:nuclear transport factor 2 family protein [Afifella pfennigii]